MSHTPSYHLVDSGMGRKLERFGPYLLSRPCSQAVWQPQKPPTEWNKAHGVFSRDQENKWAYNQRLPEIWQIEVSNIIFKISPTDFGHLGIFPEQKPFWDWIQTTLKEHSQGTHRPQVLNLFAYSGGSTLAAAKGGAAVCHLDASKGMVAWAHENAALNNLEQAPIRWIIDDVKKFLAREHRRQSRYDAIILDPPTFGRGSQGELFKIEDDIIPLLRSCRELLTDRPLFILFSCHTPGFSPLVMHHLMSQVMEGLPGRLDVGEMVLDGDDAALPVPSGTYARWVYTP